MQQVVFSEEQDADIVNSELRVEVVIHQLRIRTHRHFFKFALHISDLILKTLIGHVLLDCSDDLLYVQILVVELLLAVLKFIKN